MPGAKTGSPARGTLIDEVRLLDKPLSPVAVAQRWEWQRRRTQAPLAGDDYFLATRNAEDERRFRTEHPASFFVVRAIMAVVIFMGIVLLLGYGLCYGPRASDSPEAHRGERPPGIEQATAGACAPPSLPGIRPVLGLAWLVIGASAWAWLRAAGETGSFLADWGVPILPMIAVSAALLSWRRRRGQPPGAARVPVLLPLILAVLSGAVLFSPLWVVGRDMGLLGPVGQAGAWAVEADRVARAAAPLDGVESSAAATGVGVGSVAWDGPPGAPASGGFLTAALSTVLEPVNGYAFGPAFLILVSSLLAFPVFALGMRVGLGRGWSSMAAVVAACGPLASALVGCEAGPEILAGVTGLGALVAAGDVFPAGREHRPAALFSLSALLLATTLSGGLVALACCVAFIAAAALGRGRTGRVAALAPAAVGCVGMAMFAAPALFPDAESALRDTLSHSEYNTPEVNRGKGLAYSPAWRSVSEHAREVGHAPGSLGVDISLYSFTIPLAVVLAAVAALFLSGARALARRGCTDVACPALLAVAISAAVFVPDPWARNVLALGGPLMALLAAVGVSALWRWTWGADPSGKTPDVWGPAPRGARSAVLHLLSPVLLAAWFLGMPHMVGLFTMRSHRLAPPATVLDLAQSIRADPDLKPGDSVFVLTGDDRERALRFSLGEFDVGTPETALADKRGVRAPRGGGRSSTGDGQGAVVDYDALSPTVTRSLKYFLTPAARPASDPSGALKYWGRAGGLRVFRRRRKAPVDPITNQPMGAYWQPDITVRIPAEALEPAKGERAAVRDGALVSWGPAPASASVKTGGSLVRILVSGSADAPVTLHVRVAHASDVSRAANLDLALPAGPFTRSYPLLDRSDPARITRISWLLEPGTVYVWVFPPEKGVRLDWLGFDDEDHPDKPRAWIESLKTSGR